MSKSDVNSGVMVIITDDKGAVLASAADFNLNLSGYTSLTRAQEDRAKRAAWNSLVSDYCWKLAPAITGDWWIMEHVMKAAMQKMGWKHQTLKIDGDRACHRITD